MELIEETILNHLKEGLTVPVFLERPSDIHGRFCLFEKTSSGKSNTLPNATFAFQSYAESMYASAKLNEEVKKAVESLIKFDRIRWVRLNSDYNYTDLDAKEYRYQAVFDIGYYD